MNCFLMMTSTGNGPPLLIWILATITVVLVVGCILAKFSKHKTASRAKQYRIEVVPACHAECSISKAFPSEATPVSESHPTVSGEDQHFYCSRVDGCLVPPLSEPGRVFCLSQSAASSEATETVHFYESMTHKSSYDIRASSGSGMSIEQPNSDLYKP